MTQRILTVSALFARALSLTPPARLKAASFPEGRYRVGGIHAPRYCALRHCGRVLTVGYAVTDITTDATNEFVDTFRGDPSGLVCADCAALFTVDHNLGAWLIFDDGTCFNPLISRQSAADLLLPSDPDTPKPDVKRPSKIDRFAMARPCWSDLVRDIWPAHEGQNLVCLLTTNTKKRQWPRARVGPLGSSTPIYFHDGADEATRSIDWAKLLTALNLVEEAYAAGFSKDSIRANLMMQTKAAHAAGLTTTARMERAIQCWRTAAEFTPALLIAQKPPEGKSP
jgi:hypothetical protein